MINYPINNFKNNPYKDFIQIQKSKTTEEPMLAAVKVGEVESQNSPKNNIFRI